jgi:hypothetical protein
MRKVGYFGRRWLLNGAIRNAEKQGGLALLSAHFPIFTSMKLPYGQSNFKNIAEDCYYVDRTMYIEHLEGQNNPYQFYLRPRKFGKSLFVSMLEHYYGQQHKAYFHRSLGSIGQ